MKEFAAVDLRILRRKATSI